MIRNIAKNRVKENHIRLKPDLKIILAFCFLLYPPTFKALPILTTVITLVGPLIYLIVKWKSVISFVTGQKGLLISLLLLTLLSVVIPVMYGTKDYSYTSVTMFFFKKILTYLTIACAIVERHGKEKCYRYFMYYYACVHLIHVIATLLLVVFPQIQNMWFSVFQKVIPSEEQVASWGYTFRLGWQGFVSFRLTMHCTFAAIFTLFLNYHEKCLGMRQFILLFSGCLLGNMFYGRSGLIITLILSAIVVAYWNRMKIKRIITFLILGIIILLSLNGLKNIPFLKNWYDWMSAPIMSFISTGEIDSGSFDRLQEMSRVEIGSDTLIVGDGYYNKDGHYYMRTDIGYMRSVLFWGLIGSIPAYTLTVYSIYRVKKISVLFALCFAVVFLYFEYKGASYYEFIPVMSTITFLCDKEKNA